MHETESGLLIPDTAAPAIEKADVIWDPWEGEKLQHASEILVRHNLAFIVICKACAEAKRNFQLSVMPDAETGRAVGECDCTRHHFKTRKKSKRPL